MRSKDIWPGGVLRVLFMFLSAFFLTNAGFAESYLFSLTLNFIGLGCLAFGVFEMVNYRESYERHFGEGDSLEKS